MVDQKLVPCEHAAASVEAAVNANTFAFDVNDSICVVNRRCVHATMIRPLPSPDSEHN